MTVAGLTGAGIAPPRLAELTASSLWLLALGAGVVLIVIGTAITRGSADRGDPMLCATATLGAALLMIPAGLA